MNAATRTVRLPPKEALKPNVVVSLHGKGPRRERRDGGVWYEKAGDGETFWLDATAERMIHGVVSTGTVNTHNYSLDPAGCEFKLPVPLLFRHAFKAGSRTCVTKNRDEAKIGSIVLIRRSKWQIYIQATIDKSLAGDAVWRFVVSGEARSMSGSAVSTRLRGVVDGVEYYDKWILDEGSITRKGANPDCWCEPYRPGFTEVPQWGV
ncbi:MAG: hypothetical protein LCH70_07570 [Proteobacteria bacterium]|nr:hypothetical protein [Pseudomonadota bacterium]